MLFCTSFYSSTAQSDYSSIISEDRLSLSGLVSNSVHQLVTVDINYFLSDKVVLLGSLVPSQVLATIPSMRVGMQFRATNLFKTARLVPYLDVQYGVSRYEQLSFCEADPNQWCAGEFISDKRAFFGPSMELGTKFKLFKRIRGYGTIGLNYEFVNTDSVNDFVTEFNELHSANEPTCQEYSKLSFSFGYTYVFKSTDPNYRI